ncbi:OLC1v1006168C2 [Oldenlandia corymbosa var. corymbosa]|uniref:Laccase n=1 Tax=Oldenlandia corymbosa var. corymbosa TaxID=529605 RepID=A0AAV1DIQ9_OLDCO|nr:OLC1v1006168C2 [Oldenlandia corymbosa var. corymbosa]
MQVMMTNTTRLCETKPIVTVNGLFPGPTLFVKEGDTVLIKVVNQIQSNMTIHWHGIRQIRTGWSDGPAFITQCPIQPGQSYVYNFTITEQRGTLWWHAHIGWMRSTVHGAVVIVPKQGVPYPFPTPDKEIEIILGEWWKSDVEEMIENALKIGIGPDISDSYTINGLTGPVSSCSSPQEGFNWVVENGKKYMLRIVNAALNEELFFKIANHKLTIVEVDATYVKPFQTETIFITPGQTMNAILDADLGTGNYLMAASPFMEEVHVPIDNRTATATLQYSGTNPSEPIKLTDIPAQNDTSVATSFVDSLKSLNSQEYPARVPLNIDHSLLFTIGFGINPCANCVTGSELLANFNNISFIKPEISLLNAHFFNISGVFSDDFPGNPLNPYDYTGTSQPRNLRTMQGTRLYRLAYNSTVQLVLQDTGMISPENHPIHLHGFNFFVVGKGLGNYNPDNDPNNFNLVDPVERNTIGVPTGGWVAIRFRADNPGVWFMHCHLEVHTTWGLEMAFVVDNGKGPKESILPPPQDLPTC